VKRMPNQRIPKLVLFGELAEGKRKRGRPKLRYKDVCKESMIAFRIKPDTWESTADDSTAWRMALRTGMAASDKNIANKSEDKRQNRHMNISQGPCLPCSYCGRPCRSGIGLFSHERACSVSLHLIGLSEKISVRPSVKTKRATYIYIEMVFYNL
jgi:hypothetical protein